MLEDMEVSLKLGGRELTRVQREHLDYAVVLRHHARAQERSQVTPRPRLDGRKTLCLDLDETLIHFSLDTCGPCVSDALVTATDGSWGRVYLRPGVHRFLYQAREMFELVLFTAANRDYAEQVLPALDPEGSLFSALLTREDCTEVCGAVVKDLGAVGRPLHTVILVDDQLGSHALHPENAIVIPPYDPSAPFGDTALADITTVLMAAYGAHDVRDLLRDVYPVRQLLDTREQELMNLVPEQDEYDASPSRSEEPAWEEAEEKVAPEKVAPVGSHIQAVAPKGVQHIHRGAARTPLGEVNR